MSSTTGKSRFSEVLWFKHGEAEDAAAQASDSDRDAGVPGSHTLPIEDRYHDDGSLTAQEIQRLSLKTGSTTQVAAIRDQPRKMAIPEKELLPVNRIPRWWLAGGAVAVLVVILALARW